MVIFVFKLYSDRFLLFYCYSINVRYFISIIENCFLFEFKRDLSVVFVFKLVLFLGLIFSGKKFWD